MPTQSVTLKHIDSIMEDITDHLTDVLTGLELDATRLGTCEYDASSAEVCAEVARVVSVPELGMIVWRHFQDQLTSDGQDIEQAFHERVHEESRG
jgi:hypothetical protein